MSPKRFYDEPIPGHPVYRFDLLKCLEPLVGSPLYNYRDFLYKTIAGVPDERTALENISSIYDIFPDARPYINNVILFESPGDSAIWVIKDMIKRIDKYRRELDVEYDTTGIKVLPESHLYYYIAPRYNLTIKHDGVLIK